MKWLLRKAILTYSCISLFFFAAPAHAGTILNFPKEGYCLYVPSAAENGKEIPVLITLPGKGIEPGDDILLWKTEAEKKSFFVIDFKVDYDLLKNDADIRSLHERITDVLNALSRGHRFDAREIYLAGTSAGAVASLALSLRFPSAYQTVSLVGGAVMYFQSQSYLKNARNVKYLIVHGEHDTSVPIKKVYATKSELEKSGAQVSFRLISNSEHSLTPSVYKEAMDWFNEVYDSPIRRFARLLRNNLNLKTSQ